MTINRSLFSSANQEWETPQDLFDQLNAEFHFDLDVAASIKNAKCRHFISKHENALKWTWWGRAWCNPPYGRDVGSWLQYGIEKVNPILCELVVYLLPARTDTRWYHQYIWDKNKAEFRPGVRVRFLQGRLTFGGAAAPAPCPSMVVIVTPKKERS